MNQQSTARPPRTPPVLGISEHPAVFRVPKHHKLLVLGATDDLLKNPSESFSMN
jgi:hypothetical protein